MSRNILLDKKIRHIAIFIFIAIFETLAVISIGYLSIEQAPRIYIIIISAVFLIAIMALLLKNINLIICLVIILLPIGNIALTLKVSSSFFDVLMLPLLDILAIPMIICFLLYKSSFKDRTNIDIGRGPGYLSLLLFAFIIFCILSILWSPSTILGLSVCIKLIFNYLIYLLLAILIKNQKDISSAIRTFIFTTVFAAAAMFVSMLPIDLLNIKKAYSLTDEVFIAFKFVTYELRAAGLMETHTAALFLSFGVSFSMGLLSHSKEKKNKILLFLIIIILILASLFTIARGPIGAMLLTVIFLIFAIKNFREYLFKNLFIFALCFMFLGGIFLTAHSYIEDYIKPYLPAAESMGTEHSLMDRLEYWETAYKALDNNDAVFQGLGAGGATYYLHPAGHAHSIYLSIFFDFGLVGFIMFFLLLFASASKLFLTISILKEGFAKAMLLSISGCIISLGVAALIDLTYNIFMLWFLMGIGVATYRHAISLQEESFGYYEKL